jgi:DNA-binding transcriptional MerR regulator
VGKKQANIPDKLYFRIGEVADLVGVDTHVLRYWEGEFEMKPHRSNSGQRLYRKVELTMFMRIKHLVHEEGYTVAGAKKALENNTAPASGVSMDQIRIVLTRLDTLRLKIRGLKQELDLQNKSSST